MCDKILGSEPLTGRDSEMYEKNTAETDDNDSSGLNIAFNVVVIIMFPPERGSRPRRVNTLFL